MVQILDIYKDFLHELLISILVEISISKSHKLKLQICIYQVTEIYK